MQDFSAGKAVAAGTTGQRERALDRMVQVLDFLHAHRRPVSPGELARSIGAPRSTVYSLVKSLCEIGILETSSADGRCARTPVRGVGRRRERRDQIPSATQITRSTDRGDPLANGHSRSANATHRDYWCSL